MDLKAEDVRTFVEIFEREFGVRIGVDEARALGLGLMHLGVGLLGDIRVCCGSIAWDACLTLLKISMFGGQFQPPRV